MTIVEVDLKAWEAALCLESISLGNEESIHRAVIGRIRVDALDETVVPS